MLFCQHFVRSPLGGLQTGLHFHSTLEMSKGSCGEQHPANIRGSSGTTSHASASQGMVKEPHTTNHRHGVLRWTVLEYDTEWKEQWRVGGLALPHLQPQTQTDGAGVMECQCHPSSAIGAVMRYWMRQPVQGPIQHTSQPAS